MINEIDYLRQNADNTNEMDDLKGKMSNMEKEIAKLRRIAEVRVQSY